MPSLLFAHAGRTRLQADAGRKRPRPLAAHDRAELPPRRGSENGRADLTAAARDREGRSRRGGFGEAVLAAHGREELPPRRGSENGRADLTAAARDREG